MQILKNAMAPVDARMILAARRLRNIEDRIVDFQITEQGASQLGQVTYVFTMPEELKLQQRRSLEDAIARIPHGPLPAGRYLIDDLLGSA